MNPIHPVCDRSGSIQRQLASFHPDYCFADAEPDDAASYTNRSPYPVLHLLRETSLDAAIDTYPDIHSIAGNNIRKARSLGAGYFRDVLDKPGG